MTRTLLALAVATPLALGACDEYEREVATGAAAGAIMGGVAATLIGSNPEWTIATAAAGAIAGGLYARNKQTDECAYYTGNGDEVVVRPCET